MHTIHFPGFFQLGVRTSENKYTSPILCIHLQRHSERNAATAQNNRTLVVDGTNVHESQGPQQTKAEENYAAKEEIIMMPVEDVSYITSKLDIKKGKQEDAKSKIIPEYRRSENCCDRCCDSIRSCCRKVKETCCCCCQEGVKVGPDRSNTTVIIHGDDLNRTTKVVEEELPLPKEKAGLCDCLRCWCCRKQKLLRLIKRTEIVAEQEAKRVVTMTIEYSKYSNLDSASNPRLLSKEEQEAYYKGKFKPDSSLVFYLISNTDLDATNFNERKKDAEVLSRTVLHLKAMRDQYPSETQLDEILNQTHRRIFGDVHEEPDL